MQTEANGLGQMTECAHIHPATKIVKVIGLIGINVFCWFPRTLPGAAQKIDHKKRCNISTLVTCLMTVFEIEDWIISGVD